MTRLPIYVSEALLESAKTKGSIALLPERVPLLVDAKVAEQAGFVRYEPAVPKCATCGHFQRYTMTVADCCVDHLTRPVRADGAGYCDRHPEVRSG